MELFFEGNLKCEVEYNKHYMILILSIIILRNFKRA